MGIKRAQPAQDKAGERISLNTLERGESLPSYPADIDNWPLIPEPVAAPEARRVHSNENLPINEHADDVSIQSNQVGANRRHGWRDLPIAARVNYVLTILLMSTSLILVIVFGLRIADKPYEWRAAHPFVTAYLSDNRRTTAVALAFVLLSLLTIVEYIVTRERGQRGGQVRTVRIAGMDVNVWLSWVFLRALLAYEIVSVLVPLSALVSQEKGTIMHAGAAAKMLGGGAGKVWVSDTTAFWGDALRYDLGRYAQTF
ncbi:hypothetical protein NA57DRAFT_76476 [Rhizodiscina lignyota]|uniref:Uncharacterized protein n=1 Tax=Rhizodiscina lignyota TaxID=1504668 RepID=A0A9P4IBG8_9PEZI|nr:hypothetical protein NA57DRAFT_76476 [Rhizodiscina lignyota]